jgi:hypothetical protein
MSSNSRTEVSAELGLGLVGPEHTIMPLMASLSYSCHDPYAVKIAFHVGTDEPVEWTLARDLLAAALHSREGIGDVQAWPSAAAGDGLAGIGQKVLNIAMTSPFGPPSSRPARPRSRRSWPRPTRWCRTAPSPTTWISTPS